MTKKQLPAKWSRTRRRERCFIPASPSRIDYSKLGVMGIKEWNALADFIEQLRKARFIKEREQQTH